MSAGDYDEEGTEGKKRPQSVQQKACLLAQKALKELPGPSSFLLRKISCLGFGNDNGLRAAVEKQGGSCACLFKSTIIPDRTSKL